MIARKDKKPTAQELATLEQWTDRDWGDRHAAAGDATLPPTPRVDLYRDREKLVIAFDPGRARQRAAGDRRS